MTAATEYPRTVQDLAANKSWMGKIRTTIARYRLPEDVEDTVGEVLLLMLQRVKDGKNYIERWLPELGSYSNWVYTFVNNVCRKKLQRAKSKCGQALRHRMSIVQTEGEDAGSRGEVNERYLPSVKDVSRELKIQVDDVTGDLESYAAHSWIVYDERGYTVHNIRGETSRVDAEVPRELAGVTVRRDKATVFKCIVADMEPADIATYMRTSRTFIYGLMRDLRKEPSIVSWREDVFDRHA